MVTVYIIYSNTMQISSRFNFKEWIVKFDLKLPVQWVHWSFFTHYNWRKHIYIQLSTVNNESRETVVVGFFLVKQFSILIVLIIFCITSDCIITPAKEFMCSPGSVGSSEGLHIEFWTNFKSKLDGLIQIKGQIQEFLLSVFDIVR